MTTIKVNGGSLQAAIDSAQIGDTLNVSAGTYAGPIDDKSKKLNLYGDGAVWIEGGDYPVTLRASSVMRGINARNCAVKQHAVIRVLGPDVGISYATVEESLGYGIQQYRTDRLSLSNVTINKTATAVQVSRGGYSFFTDVITNQSDRMVADDGTGATNGGDGFSFYFTTGPITLLRPKVNGARAKTYGGVSWPYDGSAFEAYGNCAPVKIIDWEARDCVNICEVGTSDPSLVPVGWEWINGDAYGTPMLGVVNDKSCEGWLLRANKDFRLIGNRIHGLDNYFVNLMTGGSYGGTSTGNIVADNQIYLKPGPSAMTYKVNAAYWISGGVVPATVGLVDRNTVYFDPTKNPAVGFISGKGNINNLTTWQGLTGWGRSDIWTTPPPPPVVIDPCLDVKAQLNQANNTNAQLSAALDVDNSAIISLTGERDHLQSLVDQIKVLVS